MLEGKYVESKGGCAYGIETENLFVLVVQK